MSITVNEKILLPVRRDKQISSTGGGNGVTAIAYVGGAGTGTGDVTKAYVDAADLVLKNYDVKQDGSIGLKANKTYVDGSINARDVSIAWLDANKVDRSGDTMYGNLNMIENARVQTDFIDSSSAYASGFAGSGMRISNEAGDFNAVFDNLTVRKQMKVYELQISKISAVNGGIVVSCANGKVLDVSGNFLTFDENDGHNLITFANNDYIRAQEFDSTGQKYYLGQVVGDPYHSTVLGQACIEVTNITGTCWSGADVVQVGNSTNVARQSVIYITASDDGSPYIDILSGINVDGSFGGKTKVRTGNLAGITDLDFSPDPLTGYGLYATGDVYLKGNIQIANQYPAADVAITGDFADVIGTTKPEDNATLGATWGTNINNEPTSLSDISTGEGSKLSGIAAGATVGATWGTNLNSIPNTLLAPTGAGLYLSGDHMGFYNSGWKTYMDNSGNMLLGDISGTNAGLVWNNSTGVLSIKGAINITSGDVPWGTVSGATKPADNATVGATWGSNITGMPGYTGAPSGSGLFIDASYFGYYNSGSWDSYIDWNGNAQFSRVVSFGTKITGSTNGLAIVGTDIYETGYNGNSSEITLNKYSYQGGTSFTRNTMIYDGKGNQMTQWSGNTGPSGTISHYVPTITYGSITMTNSGQDPVFQLPTYSYAGAQAISGMSKGALIWCDTRTHGEQLAVYNGSAWYIVTLHDPITA